MNRDILSSSQCHVANRDVFFFLRNGPETAESSLYVYLVHVVPGTRYYMCDNSASVG